MATGNFTAGDVFYASDDNTVARTPSTSFGRARMNDANGAALLAAAGGEAAGTAAAAVAAHVAAGDPHTQYLTAAEGNAAYDAAGVAAAAVATHVGLADPHPGYALESALGVLSTKNAASAQTDSAAILLAALVTDFNSLLAKLRAAGIMAT